jgi:hypothetical protein
MITQSSSRRLLLHNLANALLFQLCWFAAILLDWYWALPAFMLLVLQVWAGAKVRVLWPLLGIALAGIVADTIFVQFGVYSFPQERLTLPGGEPVWMALLWVAFVLTLPYSLNWLVQKRLAFIITCAVAGPLSYSAGVRLDVMAFGWTALPVIAGLWAGIGLLVQLSRSHSLRSGGRVACDY